MQQAPLQIAEHRVRTDDGWQLQLKQTIAPRRLDRTRRPLLIVPGYGMNTFIFGYHPRGTSLERALAEAGFEVWSTNLRRQGGSQPTRRGAAPPSLRAYAEVDVPAAIEGVLERTSSEASRVDLIGCSLGGSIIYATLVRRPGLAVGSVVTVGAPLRWVSVHPALRLAFSSPRLAGALPFAGTQRLARLAFPMLAKVPGLLSIYMNTGHVDLTQASELTRTVEDPHPRVNKDIALWIRARDMVLGGQNVTQGLGSIERPLLLVLANRDGIVPQDAVTSAVEAWGGDVDLLRVGDEARWYAHADLFIGDHAPDDVFTPLARWLEQARP